MERNAGLSSLLVSSLHYNRTYPTVGGRLEMNRGVAYRFTVRAGSDRPVSIVANVPSPVASSVKSLATVGGGTTNGPSSWWWTTPRQIVCISLRPGWNP
jgi:hypothetical protein